MAQEEHLQGWASPKTELKLIKQYAIEDFMFKARLARSEREVSTKFVCLLKVFKQIFQMFEVL